MRQCLCMSRHNKVLPCSLMASLNDMRQAAGEFSAPRTEEVSTQEVFTHRATVRLHCLSGCSSWRLGSVSTNQTSPWPTSLLWNGNRKAEKDTKEENYLETENDLERKQLKANIAWPKLTKPKLVANCHFCLRITCKQVWQDYSLNKLHTMVSTSTTLKSVSVFRWCECVAKSNTLFWAAISSWSKFKGLTNQW